MKQLAHILFTAAFVYYASLSAGRILLRLLLGAQGAGRGMRKFLKVDLYRSEERFLSFVLGSGCLSLLVFGLAAVHLAYKGVFLALGITLIVLAELVIRGGPAKSLPPLTRNWRIAFWVGYALYAVLYVTNGVLPETSPDGTLWHVGLVTQYYRAHSLLWLTTSLVANLSEGVEMLYLFAFPFGKQAGAAMVHVLFLLMLPLGMLSYARRFGMPAAGVVGALLVFMSPVVGIDGISAYVDVAVAAIVFAAFYVLQIWTAERSQRLLIPIGLLCGFAYAAKYLAITALPFVLIWVAWQLRAKTREAIGAALMVCGCAAVMMAPWVMKNAVVVGNPFSPLGNWYFRNPFIHVSTEQAYTAVTSHLNGVTYRELPWELCVSGLRLIGLIGPVFLLSAIALAAIRRPQGRRLLLAAAVFGALPLIAIQTTRWFIPALPFIALALATVLCQWRPIGFAVLVLHAVLSWPSIVERYCSGGAWHITGLHWRPALRLESEEHYLGETLGGSYEMCTLINRAVPAGQPVFALGAFGRAYVDRDIIVAWESAFGERMSDALSLAMRDNLTRMDYGFPARQMEKIRLVQMDKSGEASWGIDEFRLYRAGHELTRQAAWRLTASPNPWDVQLAFDNNPVTRWSTWQAYGPGMYVEVDFGGLAEVDQMVVDCSADRRGGRVRVQAWTGGEWQDLDGKLTMHDVPAPPGSRFAASEVLKRNGLRWLLFDRRDWGAKDLAINHARWGIKLAAASQDHRLYHIE